MTVSKTFKINWNMRATWQYVKTPDSTITDSPEIKDNNEYSMIDELTNGTGGADLASVIWHDIRALAHSSNEEFDLAGGLTDAFGDSFSFNIIKGIVIRNLGVSGTPATLEVGGATNAFFDFMGSATDKIKIGAGGMVSFFNPTTAGYDVVAGSADILKIANTSGSEEITYQLILFGE